MYMYGINVYAIGAFLIKGPHVQRVRICIYRGQYSYYWYMNIQFRCINVLRLFGGYSPNI